MANLNYSFYTNIKFPWNFSAKITFLKFWILEIKMMRQKSPSLNSCYISILDSFFKNVWKKLSFRNLDFRNFHTFFVNLWSSFFPANNSPESQKALAWEASPQLTHAPKNWTLSPSPGEEFNQNHSEQKKLHENCCNFACAAGHIRPNFPKYFWPL